MTEGQRQRLEKSVSAKEAVRRLFKTYAIRDTSWAVEMLQDGETDVLRDIFCLTYDDINDIIGEYVMELFGIENS